MGIRLLEALRRRRADAGLSALTLRHGFTMGAVLPYDRLKDRRYLALLRKHFATVTTENEMKPDMLLDQAATCSAPDGMPVMRFDRADRLVRWARRNGLKVRGHVLVYHANVPGWFFREGYRDEAPIVSREVGYARLECYIDRVMRHFEERFPGVVTCWDVVNEPLGDNPKEYDPEDPMRVRRSRNGIPNAYWECLGDEYIERAFLFARNTADAMGADIRLFCNEFNVYFEQKLPYVLAMAQRVNSFARRPDGAPRRLLDGLGMEGYIGGYGSQKGCLNPLTPGRLERAIRACAEAGLELHITELTVRNFEADQLPRHAEFSAQLFRMFADVNASAGGPLSNVTIWGLLDSPVTIEEYRYNWNPYGGFLDDDMRPNASFRSVYEEMRR